MKRTTPPTPCTTPSVRFRPIGRPTTEPRRQLRRTRYRSRHAYPLTCLSNPPRTSRRDVTQHFSPDSNPILSPASIGDRDEGLVKKPKLGREFSRTVSAPLSRRREHLRGLAGDPVRQKTDPLANGGIGAAQAVAERAKRR